MRAAVHAPVTGEALQARGLLPPAELAQGLAALEHAGEWVFAPEWLEEVRESVRARLADRATSTPLDPGIPLGELLPAEPWAPAVLQLLHVERRDGKAYAPGAAPKLGDQAAAAAQLEAELAAEDLVRVDDRQLAAFLEARGTLRRVGRRLRGACGALRPRARAAADAVADHAGGLPRRARRLTPDGPAAARALRRRRHHPSHRRRAAPQVGKPSLKRTARVHAGSPRSMQASSSSSACCP